MCMRQFGTITHFINKAAVLFWIFDLTSHGRFRVFILRLVKLFAEFRRMLSWGG
jgi:hypothetical protein